MSYRGIIIGTGGQDEWSVELAKECYKEARHSITELNKDETYPVLFISTGSNGAEHLLSSEAMHWLDMRNENVAYRITDGAKASPARYTKIIKDANALAKRLKIPIAFAILPGNPLGKDLIDTYDHFQDMNNNGYGRLVFDYSQRESRWTQESKKQLEQCRLGFSEEGKKFLNVWGESRHPLGRFLSHHAHTPFEMPEGRFDSIVGYWNWQMINGSESGALEVMRKLSGPDAQGAGGSRYEVLKPEHPTYFYVDFERMRNSVRDALDAKLLQALPDQHYKDIRSIVGRIPIVHATEVGIGHLYPAGRTWLCEELRLAIDDFVQSRLGEAKKNHD